MKGEDTTPTWSENGRNLIRKQEENATINAFERKSNIATDRRGSEEIALTGNALTCGAQ